MSTLIKAQLPISTRETADGVAQTVNARDLHSFLRVGKDFSTWIKDRIEQYQFIENKDFLVFPDSGENSGRGRPSREYAITLDMAKELAMVERNERGKEARQYFIECERRAKAASSPAPAADVVSFLADPAQLRNALLSYSERVMQLEAKAEQNAPKVEFHDRVAEAQNTHTIQEAAKVLNLGPHRLFQTLRRIGMLMGNNVPYQRYIDAGYFRVVYRHFINEDGMTNTYTRTLVTGKGLIFIERRLIDAGELVASTA